jgi:hypothetical protein
LTPQIVEPIFDTVIRSSWNHLGHFGPMGSRRVIEVKYRGIFDWVPVRNLESRIKMIHVSFPTLLSCAILHLLRHNRPLHGHSHALDHVEKQLVFFFRPNLGTSFLLTILIHGSRGRTTHFWRATIGWSTSTTRHHLGVPIRHSLRGWWPIVMVHWRWLGSIRRRIWRISHRWWRGVVV